MHTDLKENDTFSIPADCIAKVYSKVKFMGWYNATYVYAEQQARLRLREAMNTFVWIRTLVQNENLVLISPNKLAHDLGLSRATVYNHLAKIQEEGLLIPDSSSEADAKIVRAWRICPFAAWRGSPKYMAQYIDKLPPDHPFLQYMDPEFKKRIKEYMEEL